jgi:hypothetical protein
MNLPTFVEATMVSCQPKCGEGFLVSFTRPSPVDSDAPVAVWIRGLRLSWNVTQLLISPGVISRNWYAGMLLEDFFRLCCVVDSGVQLLSVNLV